MPDDEGRQGLTDPYRVDPAQHRGHDWGILERRFEPRIGRADDDPAGPWPLPRDGER